MGHGLELVHPQKNALPTGGWGASVKVLPWQRSVAELGQAALLSADLCLAHLPPGCLARFPSCSSCLES